jgi:hypothetical protein
MPKILNLVVADFISEIGLDQTATVSSFMLRDDVSHPETTLRDAVAEFISSGTEESRQALENANGSYNWGDALITVPDEIFKKHGLTRIYQDSVDIYVEHDEILTDSEEDE